jgi:hypothetical protein
VSQALGYAVTAHVAQGRTVHTDLAVLSGSETRQHGYVVLSRGTDNNTAYVFTIPPGSLTRSPAPALLPNSPATTASPPKRATPTLTTAGRPAPVEVVAEIVPGRDGAQESAVQTRQRALADADHLAACTPCPLAWFGTCS